MIKTIIRVIAITLFLVDDNILLSQYLTGFYTHKSTVNPDSIINNVQIYNDNELVIGKIDDTLKVFCRMDQGDEYIGKVRIKSIEQYTISAYFIERTRPIDDITILNSFVENKHSSQYQNRNSNFKSMNNYFYYFLPFITALIFILLFKFYIYMKHQYYLIKDNKNINQKCAICNQSKIIQNLNKSIIKHQMSKKSKNNKLNILITKDKKIFTENINICYPCISKYFLIYMRSKLYLLFILLIPHLFILRSIIISNETSILTIYLLIIIVITFIFSAILFKLAFSDILSIARCKELNPKIIFGNTYNQYDRLKNKYKFELYNQS